MENSGKKKRSVATRREEFVKGYIHGSQVFFGEAATRKEALRAWTAAKNTGRKKPAMRKPQMTQEEFRILYLEGCKRWGETPTEPGSNREWDLEEIQRQYNGIRGKSRKDKDEKKKAFLDHMEQEMKRRYPSTE